MKNISAEVLKQWLDNEEAILIDVREPAEHVANKIPESDLCPLGTVDKQSFKLTDGKKVVIHCKSGRRSSQACQKLLALHPDLEIYNLEGGIDAWQTAGFTTIALGKKILPLDQQVQLTIGTVVFAGSVLAYWINPLFNILTGFFGAGLIFAGLSGTCGMAKLIAKMPWNQKGA